MAIKCNPKTKMILTQNWICRVYKIVLHSILREKIFKISDHYETKIASGLFLVSTKCGTMFR